MDNLDNLTNELMRLRAIKEDTTRNIDNLQNKINTAHRSRYKIGLKIAEVMAKIGVLHEQKTK